MTVTDGHNESQLSGDYCTTHEAAAYAGCSVKTIREWIHEKRLEATRAITCGSSRLRISTASLRKLVDP